MKTEQLYPVPVVRLIVCDARRRVLILKRNDADFAGGRWSLPGGKVDYGDTIAFAARRELKEETGLEGRDFRFLFYQDSLPLVDGGMHCINFYLECQAHGSIRLNQESVQYAFLAPEDLDRYQLAFRNDEALRRYWNGQ